MVKVKINEQGLLSSPYVRDATIEIELTDEQREMTKFLPANKAWKYSKGKITLVDLLDDDSLRVRRQQECFDIIDNRSQLWWNHLTEEQRSEINIWYKQWLNVTETKIIPIKPEWL